MHLIAFATILAGSCGYVLWRGGAPERVTAVAFLLAAVATRISLTGFATRFYTVEFRVFLVDLALFAVLVAVALRADRFWPLFLAGLQLNSVGAHLLKLVSPEMIRLAYAMMIAGWSYPMILLLVIGTHRHQRRLRAQGFDLPWMIGRDPESVTP